MNSDDEEYSGEPSKRQRLDQIEEEDEENPEDGEQISQGNLAEEEKKLELET